MKRIKVKKKFKLWEKIFIGISSLMVIVTFLVYGIRLVHYYKIEHPKDMGNSIAMYIKKNDTVLSGDGLYTFDEKEYIYKGKNVNNYLWYNGFLWRIIGFKNDEIKLISASNVTTIVWGKEQSYKESYIYNYLNEEFIKLINKDDLTIQKYCYGDIKLENPVCNEYSEDYVGLLSVSDYLNALGKDSYLNDGEYYWTSNTSENKAYYVFADGGINNEVNSIDSYYSYGVRPVITIKNNYEYYGGDGSVDSPYKLNEKEKSTIKDLSIGEYIKFSNLIWRVQKQEEGLSKIILDGYVNDKTYNFNNGINYLNKDFYNSLKKDKLVKCKFDTGSYGKNTNYDFKNIFSKNVSAYVGVPSVSSIFSNEYADIWLYNAYEGNSNLVYKVNSLNRLMGDVNTNKNKLRAVICIKNDLNISDGMGVKESPYVVGE